MTDNDRELTYLPACKQEQICDEIGAARYRFMKNNGTKPSRLSITEFAYSILTRQIERYLLPSCDVKETTFMGMHVHIIKNDKSYFFEVG